MVATDFEPTAKAADRPAEALRGRFPWHGRRAMMATMIVTPLVPVAPVQGHSARAPTARTATG